jgi:uncharacterized protein
MRRLTAALGALAFVLFSVCAIPANASPFGSREEAVAMVQRVVAMFKKDGADATIRAINTRGKSFIDRDLYPYVLDMDGYNRANAAIPAVRGKNLYDIRDSDGKFLIREHLEIAKGPGHGWTDFKWLNPATGSIDDKSAYVERVGDYIVCVGIYRSEQPNENTVTIVSGSPSSDDTYLQMAYDLAAVLNDRDNLRILPLVGIGGTQNIRDVRNLKGVDIGLTQISILNKFRQSNEMMGVHDDKIVYIAPLFTEEIHLLARGEITSLDQLRGQKVNLDEIGSGTSYTMREFFKLAGIEVKEVHLTQIDALDKLKTGEIAATVLIAGKPARSMSRAKAADGLHFLPVTVPSGFSPTLADDYVPVELTHEDYPDIIATGEPVDTLAVRAVLIAYNWPKDTDRHRRIQTFVEAFFPRIAEFKEPPHHPKWREVNLAATVPGWNRFDAAEEWLASRKSKVQEAAGQHEILFQEFLKWQRAQHNN